MLRCLTINDLVAITGTYAQMFVSRYIGLHKFCYLHVVWRLFGLFSGCVAIVMAVERWIALTRPFVYQKVGFSFYLLIYNSNFTFYKRQPCPDSLRRQSRAVIFNLENIIQNTAIAYIQNKKTIRK